MSDLVAIKKPLTRKDVDEDGRVESVVSVNLSDAIDNDCEGFLDILSRALVGDELLMDINYKVVGLGDGSDELLIQVSGDARLSFRLDDEIEQTPDEGLWECSNCGHGYLHDELPLAKDLLSRLVVGGIYTDRECPDCGALCFPKDKIICTKS